MPETDSPTLMDHIRWSNSGGALRAIAAGGMSITSSPDGIYPLIAASEMGLSRVVREIIRRGVEIDQQDATGMVALIKAVQYGQYSTARVLLQLGANVNAATPSGYRAIDAAMFRGDVRLARLLLRQPGIAFDPVHFLNFAVVQGYTDIVKLLLEMGSNPNSPSGTAYAPLVLAVNHAQVAIARVLLEQGASVHARDPQGRSLLTLAKERGSSTMTSLLIKHGTPPDNKCSN